MRSLRFRLIFNNLLPLLVVLPVVGFLLVYLLETQGIVATVARDLTRQAVLVADAASLRTEIWVDPNSAQAFLARISPRLSARVMLLDSGGRLMVSSDPADNGAIGKIVYSEKYDPIQNPEADVNIDKSSIEDVVVPVIRSDGLLYGFVRLDNPLSSIYERSLQLRQIMLWVVGLGLVLGVILGWGLANDLSKQLKTATLAVTGLATGQNLEILDESKSPREIGQLYRAFNTLVTRLKYLEESRKRLLANLVHEIGRPLGSLQSAVQALSGGAHSDKNLRVELLDGMAGELHRLDNLVGDLANLHDQLAGTLMLNREPVVVNEWLQRITETYREEALNKGLLWECKIPTGATVINLDAERLTLAVQNLISNAIRYTPPGGNICVQSEILDKNLIIEVSDSGPGIPPEEQEKIFEPFTRGSTARRFSQGMGLGLTITRDLVEAHGGTIKLVSKPGDGSTFRIEIPSTSP
jgi:two-component system, OmpR family, sensor histidine kinase BaeS